jgi:hypothetical protein
MSESPPASRARKLLFALVPVTVLFGGLELGLRVSGFTPVTAAELAATAGFYEGAYVHRRDMEARPWFVVEAGTARSNPRLVPRGFHDQSFPATPPEGERRLFALGGSTTQGAPYEDRTRGFSQQLEERLGAGWRVVNAGVAGLDSTRFPEIAAEAAALGAEGLVVYAGNNEVSGRLLDGCLDPVEVGVAQVVDRVRTLRVAQAWWERTFPRPLPTRADLVRNQDDCMQAFLDRHLVGASPPAGDERTDPLEAQTRATFRAALEAVADVGVPVWLAIPPIHLLPPPVGPRSPPGLDPALADAVERAWGQAARDGWEGADAAAALAEDVPSHAGLRWVVGRRALAAGDREAARTHLRAAVALDYRSTRVTPALQDVIREVCAARDTVTCVDVAARFAAAAPDGVPGEALFVDHCHPTWGGGTPLIAEALAEAVSP